MSGLSPAVETVIDEDQHWIVAVNRNQDLLGKVIVVLRRPCTDVVEMTGDEWKSLRRAMAQVTGALRALFSPDHMNYSFLMNQDAQVHLHVIPRYATPRWWGGREYRDENWGVAPGHGRRVLDPDSLRRLAEEIGSVLATGGGMRDRG